VISGPGLLNLFRFTHAGADPRASCALLRSDADERELPALVSASGLERACPRCVEALDMFVEAYGAEAGNLALRTVATAGLYIGGGIAPRILPAIRSGRFMDAFLDKEPMVDLLRLLPVAVILNTHAGLLGAAVRAAATGQTR
jgi:glucokinase